MADLGQPYDFIVIGAGIAGASSAYFLSEHGSVLLLEMESQPGYHATGRSAALFTEAYGNRTIRGLTCGSRSFFEQPPAGFSEHAMLGPRGAMFVGRADQSARLEQIAEDGRKLVPSVRHLSRQEVLDAVPVLRPDYVAGGVLEPDAMDLDVHALLQGFLNGAKACGCTAVMNAEVSSLERSGDGWAVHCRAGVYQGAVVVNAAGAWCDAVAQMAGARPVGLVPKRRTAVLFDPPSGTDVNPWPMCIDADEQFYFKPDAGRLIGSLADETPSAACDAQPEELDVAIAIDRIQTATVMKIARLEARWAGLRTFAPDKTTVVGYDPLVENFFWVAGQGGYGIQTAPSMGRVTAALIARKSIPSDLQDFGVTAQALSPARFTC